MISKAVGRCPEAVLRLGNAEVRCLLDTGAQVSTITESFYKRFLEEDGNDLVDVSTYIKISGAGGLEIPYLGYIELDMTTLGRHFPQMGFLIVKDPTNPEMLARKQGVPGVIVSNVFQFVKERLAQELGTDFLALVAKQPDGNRWAGILAMYESVNCKVVDKSSLVASASKALIPARSLKVIVCTATVSRPHTIAVVERLESAVMSLPSGLAVARCLVTVSGPGRTSIPVQIANMSDRDVYLDARTPVSSSVRPSNSMSLK